MKLDFTQHEAAQDMIRLIMRDKKLPADAAIRFAVNPQIHQKILKEGYGDFAYIQWGHADPERKWLQLSPSAVDVLFDADALHLINDICAKEHVDDVGAICQFLIFTMDALGYHI